MKILIWIIFLMIGMMGIAQVKVSGYYRKNGTYVQPHYRSSPDGNPTNNYSYPGNTNPYTGKTATGSQEAYLNNYYKRSSTYSNSTNLGTTSTYIPERRSSVPANFRFKGTIKSAGSVRLSPRDNSSEIFKCNTGDIVFVLEEVGNDYCRVDINGFIGFLSRSFIDETITSSGQSKVNTSIINDREESLTPIFQSPITPPTRFIFETKIRSDVNASLRLSPRDNSDEIYRCKSGEKVYVLENAGNSYYKVNVRGFVGYLHRDYMP